MDLFHKITSSQGILARAMRGSVITVAAYGTAQVLRLASNLILTRLLYPEAFGVMALVSVFMVGLAMFSDVGIGVAIQQSKRGDDPDFLNTAWTIHVVRGGLLWLGTCVIAVPVSHLYGAPQLLYLLPAAGFAMVISGFNPTRIETANRHLALGRVTVLELVSQIAGIVTMVGVALATASVWALVAGGLASAVVKLIVMHRYLPGPVNRFHWDPAAVRELVHFGKWIFLSTAFGFLLSQGDRAILGVYLPLDQLGIYNVGYFLATFPMMLGMAVTGRILIPIYRDAPPSASAANFARLRRMRFALSASILALLGAMAIFGQPIAALLYDARYAAAGAIVVAVACLQMPSVIGMTYDQSALAAGDSRNYFYLIGAKALVQTAAFVIGVEIGGLPVALLAQGIGNALVHPMIIWLAHRHGAWDARHDIFFAVVAVALIAVAVSLNFPALAELAHRG